MDTIQSFKNTRLSLYQLPDFLIIKYYYTFEMYQRKLEYYGWRQNEAIKAFVQIINFQELFVCLITTIKRMCWFLTVQTSEFICY